MNSSQAYRSQIEKICAPQNNTVITSQTRPTDSSESYKEAQQKAAEQRTQKNSDPENFEEPVTVQNDIPLNFMLFDRQGNSVKMFSRTCKIRRSRELYEYFENNDSIKMKIN